MKLTQLCKRFSNWFQGLGLNLQDKHSLTFQWMVLCQMVCQGKTTIADLARISASHVKEQQFRRLLYAGYWDPHEFVSKFAQRALKSLPAPKDGRYYLILDSTLKNKRGEKKPGSEKARFNEYSGYCFGIHLLFAVLHWDNYRVIVDFDIIRPKEDPHYIKENALARRMLVRFRRPKNTKQIIVLADAAFASKQNFKTIRQRGMDYVFSIARTWCFENGKNVKHFARHLKHCLYRKTWLSLGNGRRQVYWTYTKRERLRNLGDVTIVLSKKRRNQGPKKVKVLVTNLPYATAQKVVGIYKRRWWIEIAIKELKGAVGLGQHQVTKEFERVEKSICVAIVAYLALIKLRAKDIPETGPWSLFQLKHNFYIEIVKEQVERSVKRRLREVYKTKAAA